MSVPAEVSARPDFQPVVLHLRNGRRVTVRPVEGDDVDGIRSAFEHLSSESRYSRFMAPVRELSPAMLDLATHARDDRDLALLAVAGEDPEEVIVGGARYAANPGGDDCEFAVTVVDDWHGLGLGRHLMTLLMEAAAHRGLRTMEGFILTSNAGMRGLAHHLGFADRPMAEDPTVRRVSRQLDASA